MNRKAYAAILALSLFPLFFLAGCGSSSSTPPVVSIAATSGTPQSATVNTAFAAPLVATVTTGGSPTSGVVVTFTAPAQTGASGTFAGGVSTATTNASGVATSAVFTANTFAGAYAVMAAATGATTPASFSLTNNPGAAAAVSATSGSGQSAVISTAFTNPLVATVVDSGGNPVPVAGVSVTFTAPATGASGTFASNSTATEIDTTNASGVATSSAFTANATVGGPYNVTATSTGLTSANFSLTNTAVVVTSNNYSFYLSGTDILPPPASNGNYNFYALAGSVTINSSGTVVGGVQDYNEGFSAGVTSPEPSGDTITGGTLTVDGTGQGTLTLITDNAALGVSGTETLGVQFVNTNHALIVQFDGSATSSGSMDLQTLPSTLSGGYAFTLSGVDTSYSSVVAGGVFSISGTAMQNGLLDVDDAGAVTLGTPFTGTISAPDAFGRGTITGTGIAIAIKYYIVGPEAIRIIDVDTADSFVGSAFGQGAGAFSDALLGSSVFGVESNFWGPSYAAAGMFTTVPGSGTFQGVADNDEVGVVQSGATISGTYSIASNGYGSLTITPGDLGDVSALGIYMTDPTLNLNDPNNTTSGLGGALVADLDTALNGTGVLTPQTDTSPASFAGNYAFGSQAYFAGGEFDFVGQGSVTGGALSGTGLVSDPFTFFGASPANYSGVPFAGTATPDGTNAGRYTIPLAISVVSGSPVDFSVVIYQASGGQLFWLDEDVSDSSFGPLEQQGSLTGLSAARKAGAKSKPKRKQ
jgi:hypothetical protein